jgi:GntR family transcriptional repressor for pyruvate dehydrogenase complex
MRRHEEIADMLTEEIVLGDAAPGEWLPREVDLSERFDASRGVIREAIRAIETRSLVAVRHGRGQRVLPEADWQLLDARVLEAWLLRPDGAALAAEMLECRRLLEGQAAASAAERATAADVQRLSDAHAALAAVVTGPPRTGTPGAFVAAEAGFHREVVALSGNRLLERMLDPLHPALATAVRDQPAGRHAQLVADLDRVLEAVRVRDADAARAAVDMHVAALAAWLGPGDDAPPDDGRRSPRGSSG